MKTRTIVLLIVAVVLLAGGAYAMVVYSTYSDAHAACSRAADGRVAGQALAHLRDVARKRNAQVVESGEWTSAVFRSAIGSGFACGLRIRDGKLVEFRVAGASEAEGKK